MSDPFAVPDGPLPGQDVDPDLSQSQDSDNASESDVSPDPDGSGRSDGARDGADQKGDDEDHVAVSDLP